MLLSHLHCRVSKRCLQNLNATEPERAVHDPKRHLKTPGRAGSAHRAHGSSASPANPAKHRLRAALSAPKVPEGCVLVNCFTKVIGEAILHTYMCIFNVYINCIYVKYAYKWSADRRESKEETNRQYSQHPNPHQPAKEKQLPAEWFPAV